MDAVMAVAASVIPESYAAYLHTETHVINQFALLGVQGELRYADLEVKRQADVIGDLRVTGATKAVLLVGAYEQLPLNNIQINGTATDNHFFAHGLTLLLAAQQYQQVKVRVYFHAESLLQNHQFSLKYTGLVLNQHARKSLSTQPWVTTTHRYDGGVAYPLANM
jgi:hypothetical protein